VLKRKLLGHNVLAEMCSSPQQWACSLLTDAAETTASISWGYLGEVSSALAATIATLATL
jgi:hypothetical protein